MFWIFRQSLVLPQPKQWFSKRNKKAEYPELLVILVWWSIWHGETENYSHTGWRKTASLRSSCPHEYAQAEGHTEDHGAWLCTGAGKSCVNPSETESNSTLTTRQVFFLWFNESFDKTQDSTIIRLYLKMYIYNKRAVRVKEHLLFCDCYLFFLKGHTHFLFPVNVRMNDAHTGKPDYRGWAHMDKSRQGAKQSGTDIGIHTRQSDEPSSDLDCFQLSWMSSLPKSLVIWRQLLLKRQLSDRERSVLWVKHGWQRWTRSQSGGGGGQSHVEETQ